MDRLRLLVSCDDLKAVLEGLPKMLTGLKIGKETFTDLVFWVLPRASGCMSLHQWELRSSRDFLLWQDEVCPPQQPQRRPRALPGPTPPPLYSTNDLEERNTRKMERRKFLMLESKEQYSQFNKRSEYIFKFMFLVSKKLLSPFLVDM